MGGRGKLSQNSIATQFQNSDSIEQRAGELYGQWARGLSDQQREAIASYQVEPGVNAMLREIPNNSFENMWNFVQNTGIKNINQAYGTGPETGIKPITPVKMDAQEYVKTLDSAMTPLKESIVVSRGIRGPAYDALMDQMQGGTLKGVTIHDKGFMSTTAVGQKAFRYGRDGSLMTVMEITVPKGSKAIPVPAGAKDKLFWSGPQSDSEFILARGTTLKITDYSYDFDKGLTNIKAEVVKQKK
jgi:hypothetical protein